MTKKIIVFIWSLVFIFSVVPAVKATVFDPSVWIYRFNLYYDQGKLFVDRDAPDSYDTDAGPFQSKEVGVADTYRLVLLSSSGKTLFELKFDPQNGNPSFTRGSIKIEAPFFSEAKTVQFYDKNNVIALSVDLSATLFCNENNVCEAENGEDQLSCSSDCGAPTPNVSIIPSASVIPPPSDSGNLLVIVLIVIGGLAVAGLVTWFIIKNRRNKANDISITLPQ